MQVPEPKTEPLLSEVVERLRQALHPEDIYLFGSHAYGTPDRRSDLDLLVIVRESELSWYRRGAAAYKALRGIGVAVDVLVYTREEFDTRSSLPISLERTVREKGRHLYAA